MTRLKRRGERSCKGWLGHGRGRWQEGRQSPVGHGEWCGVERRRRKNDCTRRSNKSNTREDQPSERGGMQWGWIGEGGAARERQAFRLCFQCW